MKIIVGVEDVVEVTDDGAPAGRKDFIVWQPPFKDPVDPTSGRKNALFEATALMRYLMKRGVRVILFCKVRIASRATRELRLKINARFGKFANW
jgi:DEAD/DEAH box helicase domain-containing protein